MEKKGFFIVGVILTIISLLGIPLTVVGFVFLTEGMPFPVLAESGIIAFVGSGLVGHIFIRKAKKANGKNGAITAFYVLSFLQYYFPLGIILIIIWLVKFIIGIVKGVSNTGSGSSASGGKGELVVLENGFERKLKLCESYKEDYELHTHYDRYIDDIGHYWRSYDDETVIRETVEQTGRGY